MSSIAIVVVTRDRCQALERLLQRLREIEPQADEVVVVDNGSVDGTAEMVALYPGVRIDVAPGLGLAACRQRGIDLTSSDIVVMCDDDCVPAANWLAPYVDAFDARPDLGGAGGEIINIGFEDPRKGRGVLKAHGVYGLVDSPFEATHFGSANMALRRSALTEIGGYDLVFEAGYEEVDLVERLRKSGWTVEYLPASSVEHHNVAPNAPRVRRSHHGNVAMRLYLVMKHQRPRSASQWAELAGHEVRGLYSDIRGAARLFRKG
ncbi:MAG: glycosyltransferase family 2 protein, partial [Myxococcales bacterium]|nr:glycosyltransferase family 2 protein [Myxococcales bacterium]